MNLTEAVEEFGDLESCRHRLIEDAQGLARFALAIGDGDTAARWFCAADSYLSASAMDLLVYARLAGPMMVREVVRLGVRGSA